MTQAQLFNQWIHFFHLRYKHNGLIPEILYINIGIKLQYTTKSQILLNVEKPNIPLTNAIRRLPILTL